MALEISDRDLKEPNTKIGGHRQGGSLPPNRFVTENPFERHRVGGERDPSLAPVHHFQATVMQCRALFKRDHDHSSF